MYCVIFKKNEELELLIKKKNIVRFIKSHRLRWAVHVIGMDTTRTDYILIINFDALIIIYS